MPILSSGKPAARSSLLYPSSQRWARSAARQITKRLIDTGNIASVVVADLKRSALARARTAFLDYGAAPVAPVAEAPAGAEGR